MRSKGTASLVTRGISRHAHDAGRCCAHAKLRALHASVRAHVGHRCAHPNLRAGSASSLARYCEALKRFGSRRRSVRLQQTFGQASRTGQRARRQNRTCAQCRSFFGSPTRRTSIAFHHKMLLQLGQEGRTEDATAYPESMQLRGRQALSGISACGGGRRSRKPARRWRAMPGTTVPVRCGFPR